MFPEIHILSITINTYYGMMFLGFVLMLVLMLKRRNRYFLNTGQAICFTAFLMVSGILGCKILYILENIQDTLEKGVTLGGFSFFGAVFLVPPLMALFGLLFKLRPAQSINASAPLVCAMVGTIRVGCFLNGCCGGWTTASGFTWPTQAMESIGDFAILLWLLEQEGKGSKSLYPLFMLAYSILRFLVEFLRNTPKNWLHLSHGQWFAIAASVVAVISITSVKKRGMGNV